MGDVAMPYFQLAKKLGSNPAAVAKTLANRIEPTGQLTKVESVGPYLNFFLDAGAMVASAVQHVLQAGKEFGSSDVGAGQRVMIEYSGPNSNKALHLGHLRNNQLGIALINVLRTSGYEVIPVNIINDRGIAICQSMLAYQLWGEDATPQNAGIKGDHFVGELYARYREAYDKALEEWLPSQNLTPDAFAALEENDQRKITGQFEEQHPLTQQAKALLEKWEAGDQKTRELWQTMNSWVYEGFNQTYDRQGVCFDQVYLESETYDLGREIVFAHEKEGKIKVLRRDDDGNLIIDLSAWDLTKPDKPKVLVRANGTTIYITQDVGTAVLRFKEYEPLDQLIYVVACEQNLHFQILFKMLELFGYQWASRCFHRSYGMVNLPTGKMSSRKLKQGGVFLADDLMDRLHQLALEAITSRDPLVTGPELGERAELIGLAALKYYLLRANPQSDIIFNAEESLQFEGNTGPYLLYALARIRGIMRKANEPLVDGDLLLLKCPEEVALAKALAAFPDAVESAATAYNPSVVASQVYEVAKAFSQFYTVCPILNCESSEMRNARLQLAQATAVVLENGLCLLGIATPERM
jgi:arginyl-tRNA synthetase